MRIFSCSPRFLCLGLIVGCVSGCASLHIPWAKDRTLKATAQNPAVQVVCLWEQAEGRDPDGIPCRGFAGQIMFLANRHAAPVEIDGDVRIYLFDDVGSTEEQAKPLRQFDFSSEAWKLHLTKSAVGPSYSVFVPYVRRGQHNAQCSLRVRLAPKVGPAIFSEISTMSLRGPSESSDATLISPDVLPEDRVQAEVNQALSRVLQPATTIPLTRTSSGNIGVTPQAPKTAAPSSADDRLARMEQLLETVLAEKAGSPSNPPTGAGIQPAHFETPSPADSADSPPPRRFKLNPAAENE